MISKFPDFKKITTADRKGVELYTHLYKPYSDFNFTSLWAWDTNGERMISELNGNLVVRFTDYETCEPFFSFLGNNKPKETAQELIHFAEKSGVSPILRFVPEESISGLESPDFKVEEDRDNFDYIFYVPQLIDLQGSKFKEKRHSATRFLREYPDAVFKLKELSHTDIHEQIIAVLKLWKDKKESDGKVYDSEHEKTAIIRLLETANDHKLFISCVFLYDTMIGFSIDEILPLHYAISHFFKADNSYEGIYDFLNREVSKFLTTQDVKWWNWEQDLGIENLRKSKMSYSPVDFLKKYKVSLCKK